MTKIIKLRGRDKKSILDIKWNHKKYSETPAPATSKRGRNTEQPAALLRVRTGP